MAISTGSIPRLLLEGLKNTFGTEYDAHQMQFDKIFSEESSTKAYEVDQLVEGFSLAPVKTEGDDLAYDNGLQQGINPKYIHLTYAKGFQVTAEALADEQYGLFAKRARALAFSMQTTRETVAANVLNNGFDSAYTMAGGDGKELFDSAHRDGSLGNTYSNILATAADLSEASLEDMLIQIGNAVDSRGLQIALQAERLIVPVGLQFTAERILRSTDQSGTANNDINAVRSMRAVRDGCTVNNYLTDADGWFIKTNAKQGLTYMNRQDAEYGEDNAFNSGNARFKASQRYSFGWSDARGCYGTPGA